MSTYTNAFAFTQLCGVLCAPWNGLILDRHKRGKTPRPEGNQPQPPPPPPFQAPRVPGERPSCRCPPHTLSRARGWVPPLQCPDPAVPTGALGALADLRASVLSLVVTVTLCVLFSVCAAVPMLPVQFATFVLQVLSRSFLYGGNAAFLAIA